MSGPHEYKPAQLGHANVMCKHCGGTPNENAVLGPICPGNIAPTSDLDTAISTAQKLAGRMGGKFVPRVVEALVPDDGRQEIAAQLRELAEYVEKGEVVDLVIAYDKRGDKCFCVNGFYQDKWRMLGAIEYMKTYVFPTRE